MPPAATRSSWWPSSTSTPSRSTSTRSARAAVDMRWAMAIVVRPSASLVRAREMRTSVSGVDRRRRLVEHEHVGVGDAGPQQGDELALAGRELVAALADVGDQAVGQAVDPVLQVEATDDRASTSAIDVPGRAKPTLAAIVPLNRNGSCDTTTRRWTAGRRWRRGAAGRRRCGPRRSSGRRSGRSAARASSCRNRSPPPAPPAGRPGCGR